METQSSSRYDRRKPGVIRIIAAIVGRTLFVIGTLFLIGVCSAAMFAYIFWSYVQTTLTPTLHIDPKDYTMNQSSIIYYHDDAAAETGGWVEYKVLHGEENRILVNYSQIPDAMWQAVVAIEDHRFFEHEGVDWHRTGGAVLNMFLSMRNTFGGSTITQQVLKNMTKDNEGTVNRKIREIFRALEFEKEHSKQEILELYLNTVYFGMGCYGVQTAAQYYFDKDVWELTPAECASIIAITNNPSRYGPMFKININVRDANGNVIGSTTPRELNKERQELILRQMWDPEVGLCYLTDEEYRSARAEELHFVERSGTAGEIAMQTGAAQVNSWFMDQAFEDVAADLMTRYSINKETAVSWIYNKGYRIYTTLDPKIQEIADSVYQDRSNLDLTSRDGQKIRSAITILDPHNGNIVAIVGDMGEKPGNRVLSYASLRRQVGSSIKPLTVYSPAMDAGAVTPASSFDDYPVMKLNGNPWPKNSPPGYGGWTNIRTGVRRSINTIAVQTLQALGVENSYQFATEKLHLGVVEEDKNLSSLGMGGLTYGLTTIEMAGAYGSIANGGIYNRPRTYLRVLDASGNVVLENTGNSNVAMKETTAYLMTSMLESVVESGTGTSAKFKGMHIAGKTGTTSDNYDRYFVGYTPYYVAAVWTGYKYNARISYSGNPAITMWKKVMEKIHEGLEDKPFDKPETGLDTVKVCQDSGKLATDACRSDLRGNRVISVEIEAGTAPTEKCELHVYRKWCTRGHCVATSHCPSSSTTYVGLLNLSRESYGGDVYAEDSGYRARRASSCPVHSGSSSSSGSGKTTTTKPKPAETTKPKTEPAKPAGGEWVWDPTNDSGSGNSGNTGGNSGTSTPAPAPDPTPAPAPEPEPTPAPAPAPEPTPAPAPEPEPAPAPAPAPEPEPAPAPAPAPAPDPTPAPTPAPEPQTGGSDWTDSYWDDGI